MKRNNKSTSGGLFYNNKFLCVFSFIVAVVFWAVVKVNYSDDITKNVSDVSISFDNILKDSEYTAYIDSDISFSVTLTGKSYNVGNPSITKDNIIIEPVNTFVDSTGNKYVNLSARFIDPAMFSGVEIQSVSPSGVNVYFDREATATLNVVARLENKLSDIVEGDFVVGQPVPSVTVLDIKGPSTIINNIEQVYFDAVIDEADIPLTASKEFPATISFDLPNKKHEKFISYDSFDEEKNPATVNVPVYVTKDVPTKVKFVGQPEKYNETPPGFSVSPSKVTVSYNPQDVEQIDSFTVGTVDFRDMKNGLNKFTFTVDETMSASLTDKTITSFDVTVDMSGKKIKEIETMPTKIVLSGKVDGYDYSADISPASFFDKIRIIGPAESLEKITADDIQIEINVSDIDVENESVKVLEITNISIQSELIKDCWVYGKCNAKITVKENS